MASDEPRPGDLIEILSQAYKHWAIYVGNGYVVHLRAQGSITGGSSASVLSAKTDKAIVKKELLCDVAGKNEYRVNNKHDDKYRPLPPRKIIQQAELLVGQEMPYNLTSENCEHFVNDLRYGVPRSDQAKDKTKEKLYLAAGVVLVGVSLIVMPRIPVLAMLAAAGFVSFMMNKNKPEKQ